MGNNYGDWLSPRGDKTPKDLLGTAYWAYDARLMSEMAGAIGRARASARATRSSSRRSGTPSSRPTSRPTDGIEGDTQTGYALALHMDLLPEEQRAAGAPEHLVEGHRAGGLAPLDRLRRGQLPAAGPDRGRAHGRRLPPAQQRDLSLLGVHDQARGDHDLGALGRLDGGARLPVAQHELLQPLLPGLRRRVALPLRGGDRPGPADAGLRPHRHPAPPRRRPHPRQRPSTTRCGAGSSSAWSIEGERFRLKVTIPPNTTATVHVPAADGAAGLRVGPRRSKRRRASSILRADGEEAVLSVGSGDYEFVGRVAQ